MSIPFELIYNYDKDVNVLPSDRRNMSIIHGVKFGMILDHIQKRNISGIKSWINGYENKLTEYLNKKHKPSKNKDLVKYCTNLNHILDYVVQGINNLKMYDCVYWIHQVDEGSKKALRQYPSLNCERDLHNYKNKYLFFKKLMLDLCEDIEYIKKNQHFLKNKKKCPKIMSRLQYREKTLMQLFDTFYNKSMFYQDSQCSINFIHRNLSNISCDNVGEKPNITGASEGSTVTASPSSERAEQHADEKLRKTEHEGVLETKDSQDPDHGDGLDDPGPVDPIPEGLKFSLPVNEDPPKLDTTYAAASLAGISLFGTILYKYGPFRNRLNPRRGAINGSNIFPLDNNVYDANVMNNFEYLQTGIPNYEYQLGYGSATDY